MIIRETLIATYTYFLHVVNYLNGQLIFTHYVKIIDVVWCTDINSLNEKGNHLSIQNFFFFFFVELSIQTKKKKLFNWVSTCNFLNLNVGCGFIMLIQTNSQKITSLINCVDMHVVDKRNYIKIFKSNS